MRGIAEFTKTTLIGGLLVIVPIYFTILLLAKTAMGLAGLMSPVTKMLPEEMELRSLVAWVLILVLCFVAGIIVRTGPGLRAKNALEESLLKKIPGYSMLRGLTGRVTGASEDATFAVALVEIEEALVPAFIVEELPDGMFTVFVPSVPTPAAGSLYILTPERVHRVDVPFPTALAVITKWGQGSGALLEAMRAQEGAAPVALTASRPG